MKKSILSRIFTAAIIALGALLCLTACGGDTQSQSENSADATAASTVLTTTVADENESTAKTTTTKTTNSESKTTTTTENITTAQTTTVTEATTTTTVATTTVAQTTAEVIDVSENAKLVEELIRNLGGIPTDNLDSYVANATTIEELHTAIKQYLTDEQLAYTVGDQLITMDMFTWLTDLEGRNLSAIVYRDGVGFALITNVDAEDATFYIDGEFVVSVTVADEICNENWEMTPIVMYPN